MMAQKKFLMFEIGNGKYALPLDSIQQVVDVPDIMPVPETPKCILGVTNVRGEIIPVMDLSTRLEMGRTEITEQAKLAIAFVDENKIAFQLESLPDVISENSDNISTDLSNLEIHINTDFVRGIIPEKFLVILDIKKLVEME